MRLTTGVKSTRAIGLAVLFALGSIALSAQTPTFNAGVNVVRVDVLVTDGNRPIDGLHAEDFDVLDNGVAQHVDLLASEGMPLNVVLALDMSDSVTGRTLDELRGAGRALVTSLEKADRVALVTFGTTVVMPVPLTADAARVVDAINAPADSGETALVDASYAALAAGNADVGRALVVIFSDGADTASFLDPESVLTTARRMNVTVYGVTTPGSGRATFLHDLSDMTGGQTFGIQGTRSLGDRFVAILDEFRHRYVLSYTPTGVAAAGWHRLEVRVKGDKKAVVRARPGYLAGS